jgi:hypothetical protein
MAFKPKATIASPEQQEQQTETKRSVSDKVNAWFNKSYGTKPLTAQQDRVVKIYYALRDGAGKRMQDTCIIKESKKRFDWRQWNEEVFPNVFGTPLKPKLSLEEMVELAKNLTDFVTQDMSVEEGVKALVAYNKASQEKRSSERLLQEMIGVMKQAQFDSDNDGDDDEPDFADDGDDDEDDDFE